MNATKSSTPAITSLTSKSDNTNGSTSISEQLAISVANKICEQRTRNNNSDDDELPTSPTEAITTTTTSNGNKTVNCTRIQNRQIRVVSAEHHSTTTSTSSTNETHKTDEQNSKSNNSNCMSSMSSAVADLASGMPNFGSSTNNNNGNNGSSGNNAPIIISGTAAAVLALQNPFNNDNDNDQHTTTGNIVSSSNGGYDESGGNGGIVIQSGEGSNNTAVPNPLSILSDMATSATTSISSPTDQSNNKQLNRQSSNGSNNLSPTQVKCYADGAPIISGTAAAQKFHHTATTISLPATTSATTNYNATNIIQNNLLSDDVILAVANINPYDTEGIGGQPYNNGTISMKSGTNSALFSVNHGTTTTTGGITSANNSISKVQQPNNDDDIGSIIPDAANIKQSKDLGGMDILAELTCHALPMPTTSIPSYQEIYQEQQQHQGSGIREGTRQSSIPSYQEIYREMGLSPQSNSTTQQQHSSYATEPQHQPSNSQPQHRGTTYFGHIPNRDELEEGKEIYTRKEIAICGGHCAENKDVHGNMREGCDSLCLKDCMEKDIRESDGLLWFLYSTDRANGGGALCRSYHEKRPLRVFRSSLLNNKYAPPFLDVEDDIEDDSDVAYRYDGLYMVRAVWDIYGNETESHPVIGENGWQTFFCTRMPRRPLEKEKREEGIIYNTVGCQELWGAIQSMRGVRRPKKFEITMPPEKLPPIKRCAISGKFRDRKCVGYVKPVVEVPVEDVSKAKNKAPSRIKSSVPSNKRGRQRRQQQQEEEEDSDLDEADESNSEDSSEEDTVSRKRAQSPKHKVMTPRPRLNSSSQLKRKTSSASAHDNDSSDSETSTAAATTQSKKRARSPSRKVILNNSLDVSAFFPKRASAARAEAANRNIVGSRSYKRKSSETTSSAAAVSKGKQGGGGRKRAKANRRDEDEFSTSSEEDSNPNSIDHSILTVGSRILVAYKGSVFKSTIRKRREKSGKHDFLIHYDGNKKTNVHWITVDKITKILEINVDTPPKKTVGKKIGVKKRGNNGGGRRKAAATAKQDSMDSQESVSGKKAAPVRKDSMASQDSAVNKRVGLARSQSLQQSHYQDGSDDEEADNKSHDSDDDSKKDEKSTNEESTAKSIPQAKKTATTKIVKAVEKKKSAPKSYPKASKEDEDEEDSSSSESEPEEPPKRKRSNIKTTTVATATSRNSPRKAVVSDTKSPTKNRSIPPGLSSSSESDSDDESSTSSSDEEDNKKVAAAEPSEEYKYPVGSHVYVEYRRILYSSSILKAKRKRTVTEYLVHYEGYKKSSNRWVKEKDLHEVNTATTRRYEEQRHIPTDNEADQQPDASATTRRKNSEASEQTSMDGSNRSVATKKKQPPPRRMRSDASEAALDALPSGVSFLAGSMVFVDWSGSLYFAKMMKKRYSGDRTEYLISYDGFKRSHDAWVSINKIYEVNPQSKRVFKMTEVTKSEKPKRRPSSTPKPVVPKRRETRKKAQDDEEAASSSTRNSDAGLPFSRSSSQASQSSSRQTSSIDMNGIEPGVDFLPGSQVFAEYKGGLCLAKMVKKRGKDDYMEYFVQYTGLKKSHETWLSVSMVWEINPQTKRMFRKLEVKK